MFHPSTVWWSEIGWNSKYLTKIFKYSNLIWRQCGHVDLLKMAYFRLKYFNDKWPLLPSVCPRVPQFSSPSPASLLSDYQTQSSELKPGNTKIIWWCFVQIYVFFKGWMPSKEAHWPGLQALVDSLLFATLTSKHCFQVEASGSLLAIPPRAGINK